MPISKNSMMRMTSQINNYLYCANYRYE